MPSPAAAETPADCLKALNGYRAKAGLDKASATSIPALAKAAGKHAAYRVNVDPGDSIVLTTLGLPDLGLFGPDHNAHLESPVQDPDLEAHHHLDIVFDNCATFNRCDRLKGMATSDPLKVVIVGQGYVGLPLAMRAVEVGFNVVGLDLDGERVKRLSVGEPYVEDVTEEQLANALSTGRYQPSTEPRACAGFDIAVITVPTPLRDGNPDLSYIEASVRTLARYVRPGACVVLESTTYPGTTEELVGPILEEGSGLVAGSGFRLGYSPERIDPGNARWSLVNTPKVVSGIDAASLDMIKAFYDRLVERTVPVATPKEAELAKLLENTFRHVNIALVNELAMYAADLDIDVWSAIDAASTKPFGFMRFTPGPGVGGHCLPIDPSYLSWRVRRTLGQSFRFVELANDINDHMPDYVVRRLTVALNCRRLPVAGSRILLLGLAYKRNTGDARESPALVVADRLLALGADLAAADPHVGEGRIDRRIERVDPNPDELAAADAVVLLTDHDAFDLAAVPAQARYVLDTRHRLTGERVEHL